MNLDLSNLKTFDDTNKRDQINYALLIYSETMHAYYRESKFKEVEFVQPAMKDILLPQLLQILTESNPNLPVVFNSEVSYAFKVDDIESTKVVNGIMDHALQSVDSSFVLLTIEGNYIIKDSKDYNDSNIIR